MTSSPEPARTRAMTEKTELSGVKTDRVLNILGLARRAGMLLIGQDQVLSAAKAGTRLLVITSDDVSAAVLRSLRPHEEKGAVVRVAFADADRTELGERVGLAAAQIAALPRQSGFAKKILNIFNDGSDADE